MRNEPVLASILISAHLHRYLFTAAFVIRKFTFSYFAVRRDVI